MRRRLLGAAYESQIVYDEDLRNSIGVASSWKNCQFKRVKFGKADFLSARFKDCTFVDCQMGQIKMVGNTLHGCLFRGCDLDQADLTASDIQGSFFTKCRMQYSVWTRAYFIGGSIDHCDLHGANLDFAQTANLDLRGSNFWGAVVPIGCSIFYKNKVDDRQINLFMSLLCQTDGNTDAVRNVTDPKMLKLVQRLLTQASA